MQTRFKKIEDERDLRGKKILLRADLNVPIENGEVRDDFRIRRILPTLEMLHERGARTIVISHIENGLTNSLEEVSAYISRFIEVKDFVRRLEDAPKAANSMTDGEIIVLENLRIDPGEKGDDPAFAAKLARLADLYVNDAFSVSHRAHASVVSVPKFLPHFAGPLLAEEIEQLSKAFDPAHPFLFVLGGAKFDTKLPLVRKFLGIADRVFIGGALANDAFKAKGYEVGRSVVSRGPVDLAAVLGDPKLMLPLDVVAANDAGSTTKLPTEVIPTESILDAGERSVEALVEEAKRSEFILWNGPLGDYEKGFSAGTEGLARGLASISPKTIIGGGDTVAVVAKLGILDKFGFVSTGGGAMLEFLAQGTLPGIEALES